MANAKPAGHCRLIGKAGVGLAMFHFGRLGHEFVATTLDSAAGDLWVDFGAGPVAVEVKAATVRAWTIGPGQISRASWFVFVSVNDGGCWLIASDALQRAFSTTAAIRISDTALAKLSPRALHSEVAVFRRTAAPPEYVPGAKGWRTVRHKLTTGEIKEYRYRR